MTHVFERSFTASDGVALLRCSTLRHWPPRYTDGAPEAGLAQSAVSESVSESESESEVARDAVPAAYERRTRVRALLKPEPGRRKADTAR